MTTLHVIWRDQRSRHKMTDFTKSGLKRVPFLITWGWARLVIAFNFHKSISLALSSSSIWSWAVTQAQKCFLASVA